ncbi:MAG: hypothetical protein GYB68_01115, partial [Chloroflexi bacterium]|nr:hypothetical protein [Chloroflexota bacterium]
QLGMQIKLKQGSQTIESQTCEVLERGSFDWLEAECPVTADGDYDQIEVLIGAISVDEGLWGVDAVLLFFDDEGSGGGGTPIGPLGSNLFDNPSFEDPARPVVLGEINVSQEWQPFYCDEPYTPEKCPAERQGEGNPEDLMMRRPEYKMATTEVDASRVNSGDQAQQWFCFFGACRAGVYQTINTTAGKRCIASAQVQTWSANSFIDGAVSEPGENSEWRILVDTSGGSYAFASGLLSSEVYDHSSGHYDAYLEISFEFTATGSRATIFFENLRLWPFQFNDSYIDDASVRCEQ